MTNKMIKNYLQKLKSSKNDGVFRGSAEFELTPEMENELKPENPIAQRCKILKELGETFKNLRLENGTIEKLWILTHDIIIQNKNVTHRQAALYFYQQLIASQYERLEMMRAKFFYVIRDHDVAEDIVYRLDLLDTLTDNGKYITHFEESIGIFMVQWAREIIHADIIEKYLEILSNIIKYNGAYLDKNVVVGIIQLVCELSCSAREHIDLKALGLLDDTICYLVFPDEVLTLVIETLCRTINNKLYIQTWKIMKKLLGTNLGHASLRTLCNILNNGHMYDDEILLRGAIFHINTGLWCPTISVTTLFYMPSTVLSSFLKVLSSRSLIVNYELVISLKTLIQARKSDLNVLSWDIICAILMKIADNIDVYEELPVRRLIDESNLKTAYHDLLTLIEELIKNNEIEANPDEFYPIIFRVVNNRSEESVYNLMKVMSLKISVTQPGWLDTLYQFMDRFLKSDNPNIRVEAIDIMVQITENNRDLFEDEILERIVVPHLSEAHDDCNIGVRMTAGVALLNFVRHCNTKRAHDLLDILDKIINKNFELFEQTNTMLIYDKDLQDVQTIVDGLIELFSLKMYHQPISHAIKIYQMLIFHLSHYYRKTRFLSMWSMIRFNILVWMFKGRSNASYHLGYPDANGQIRFSYYLGIDVHNVGLIQDSNSHQNPNASISIRQGCKQIVKCLQMEEDWSIIQLVLKEMPKVMHNKAMLQSIDMDSFAETLIKLYHSKEHTFRKPNLSDFQALILPTIASLVPYHNVIPRNGENMINALTNGLMSHIPKVCVHALTLAMLEMPDIMLRRLPDVLLQMSKMSTTVSVAVPVLEFLSTLNRLPSSRVNNFVVTQYMSVFAASVPYTNPYKYDHYTVSLAHHVIAGWFLKCRLPLRRNLVNYIIKGFETHVQIPFQELNKVDFSAANEDSSDRKRSASLTEQGSRRRKLPSIQQLQRPKADDALYNFHMELVETCIDFLARHTFSPCYALPKRFPTVETLLSGGQSLTWLVGHNLITITTSACSSTPVRNGLCDRCAMICKIQTLPKQMLGNTLSSPSVYPTSPDTLSSRTDSDSHNKRYTKASLQHTRGQDSDSTDITSSTSSSTAPTPFAQHTEHDGRFFQHSISVTTDVRYRNSSGSLEALSRRGSNPDTRTDHHYEQMRPSGSSNPFIPATVQQSPTPTADRNRLICSCICAGWAEICVRRPTGNISWVMRIQNPLSFDSFESENSLRDLINIYLPPGIYGTDPFTSSSLFTSNFVHNSAEALSTEKPPKEDSDINIHQPLPVLTSKSVSVVSPFDEKLETSTTATSTVPINIPKTIQPIKVPSGSFSDVEIDNDDNYSDVAYDDAESRARNPVRRVNSSPEMSSNYRHPYLNQKTLSDNRSSNKVGQSDDSEVNEIEQQQKKKSFNKEIRVSCEAIPEEMAGNTPPSLPGSVKDSVDKQPLSVTRLVDLPTSIQQNQFEIKKSTPTLMGPSISMPADPDLSQVGDNTLLPPHVSQPKKQFSADDALNKLDRSSSETSATAKLKLDMPKVTTKPPQSPTPVSPRLLAKNSVNGNGNGNSNSNRNDMQRERSKTISVVREHNNKDTNKDLMKYNFTGTTRSGISPSSIFLQLYNTGKQSGIDRPMLIGPTNSNAIKLIDLIPPFETHKIGVLYLRPGQPHTETEIFKNRYGSLRYMQFLSKLGTLIALQDAKDHNLFVNMETDGRDGKFTYVWQDDIVQVTFHVATLMPNLENDPYFHEKKKQIGNDFVSIVYNDSDEEYNLNTIRGQFNYACVVVQPLELNSNRIFILAKDTVSKFICHNEPQIVSDNSAPLFARQLALHANLASLVAQSLLLKNTSPYASNWLERLRKIKHLRNKIVNENNSNQTSTEHASSTATTTTTVPIIDVLKDGFLSYTP